MAEATNFFLKLTGITGEAKEDKHKDWIEVLSWSWGGTNAGSAPSGHGGGTSRFQTQDFQFACSTGLSSTGLLKAATLGTQMDGTFEGIKPGGKGGPWVYIKFEFKEAMVTSYQINGSPDQIPTESITLNFTSIKEEYADQNSTGGRGAATNAGWDHKANKAL